MATILSYLKTFKFVVDLFKVLSEWFRDRNLRAVEQQVVQRNEAVARINKKIKEEAAKEQPSDEAIKDLHRRLNNISGKL